MKSIQIKPQNLRGEVIIPPSKSMSHRAIICAALSSGESKIGNIAFSDDTRVTIEGMRAFGAQIQVDQAHKEDRTYRLFITGDSKLTCKHDQIHCKESGSTLRFLIPMATLVDKKISFSGEGKLVQRPLDTYYEIFKKQNIDYETQDGKLPLKVLGKLKPGIFSMRGDISSQFITGLLFVLPLLDGDSKIHITTPLESKGYIDLTLEMLEKFGIDITHEGYQTFKIKGCQEYIPYDYVVEGDYSQGAFWMVAGLLGASIMSKDLKSDSLQGDKAIIDILKSMGGKMDISKNSVCTYPSKTHGTVIDASDCPDLVPVLSVLAALSKGVTKIVNAKRLRIKESDRLCAMATELTKLGADIEELEDGLIIHGKENLKGGKVNSWNDHRIAMALAVASIKCTEEVIIENAHVVSKSYPSFWEHFKSLGGNIHEWHVG